MKTIALFIAACLISIFCSAQSIKRNPYTTNDTAAADTHVASMIAASNLVNTASLSQSNFVPTSTITVTNWVSGKWYTNGSREVIVWLNVQLTCVGVSGSSACSLWVIAGATTSYTNLVAVQTIPTSPAVVYDQMLMGVIPTNAAFTFTNQSSGAGNGITVLKGQSKAL